MRTGGLCEARPCRARRDEDQGERLQAQGDELRAHGEACGGLEAEVERWPSAAEAADAEEDRPSAGEQSGAGPPEWVADKKRAEKIRAAKAELEAEAKAAAATKAKAQAEAEERRLAEGRKKPGKPAARHLKSLTPKRRRTSPIPKAAS